MHSVGNGLHALCIKIERHSLCRVHARRGTSRRSASRPTPLYRQCSATSPEPAAAAPSLGRQAAAPAAAAPPGTAAASAFCSGPISSHRSFLESFSETKCLVTFMSDFVRASIKPFLVLPSLRPHLHRQRARPWRPLRAVRLQTHRLRGAGLRQHAALHQASTPIVAVNICIPWHVL